jgi:YebC/PmpR family DNA-binding regulatory protein
MAGHSKWAKIKHQKAVNDVKKAKVFSRLLRMLSVEAKRAKGDRNSPGVRLAVEKAKKANVPGDVIDRCIEKATGDGSADLESITYEAYGPGGTAILIETLTDSRNRTAQELRHLISEKGGTMANPGAAAWAFTKNTEGYEPNTAVDLSDEDTEKLSVLVDALEEYDDVQDIYTNAA